MVKIYFMICVFFSFLHLPLKNPKLFDFCLSQYNGISLENIVGKFPRFMTI